MALVLCAGCRRHVFPHEPRCPFCASDLAPAVAASAVPATERVDLASRRQRYAAALVASACALGSAAACAPSQPAESPNQETLPIATASVAPRQETRGPPHGNSSMTFGGPADDEPTRSVTPLATATASSTATVSRPPPPPPPPEERWNRRGGQCVTQGNRVICPPYGCVFPDEACDVLRA